jgi:hypothetical protein
MPADLLFLVAAILPFVLIALAIRFAWPAPRMLISAQVFAVMLLPLALLSLYLVHGYQDWSWSIFPYGSLVPHALAAAVFLSGLILVLYRAPVEVKAKFGLGTTAPVAWPMLWLVTLFTTACAMGDCF